MNRTPLAWAAALCLLPAWAQAVTCQDGIPASNPDSIYIAHGDGTVTDTRTGLMWKQCREGYGGASCAADGGTTSFDWQAALTHANGHTFAGHSDWRLPNLKELRSLVEECRSNPAINDAIFPNATTSSSVVWSGSPVAGYPNLAWHVYFSYGNAYSYYRGLGGHVRLVRAGQSLAPLLPEGPDTGQSVTVATPGTYGWQITRASTQTVASLGAPALPAGVTLPHGVVRLELHHGTQASAATVVLTYPQALPAGAKYYKYGKTAGNPTDHWYEFAGAAISGNTVTLTLVDGGAGDGDLQANSVIVDPGGVGVMAAIPPGGAAAIPTLSQWGTALLAGMLGLFSLGALRRRG